MGYHEAFWTAAATVAAAAVLVATAVSLGQSISTMVDRIRERRLKNDPRGSRSWVLARRRALVKAYLYSIVSVFLTMYALFASLWCLMDRSDAVPELAVFLPLLAAIVLAFVQVFATAEAKLAEADREQAHSSNSDGSASLG